MDVPGKEGELLLNMYIHLQDIVMKQEKLCESEDMTQKDYGQWYADPLEQQKFKEELGAENDYWAQKAAHSAKMAETMVKLYSEHKTVRDKQVGGDHYKNMRIQPWDVIDQGPVQQAIGFYRYNALKYLMRAGTKGEFKEDVLKAQHYLEKLIQILE